ncbi:MAG: BglG family transcription antiterminator [Chloroflexota bacterium]
MRVYNRKLKILKELIECDGYLTSEFLSQKIKVSSRTIRDDIKRLSIDLKEEDIKLLSIPGKGYCIQKQDKETAINYYSKRSSEKKSALTIPKNRVYHILQTLLFAAKPVTIEELADRLFVSTSTVEKDLVNAEKWLASQKIELIKKPLAGIQVSGIEIAHRYAMVNCLLDQQNQHTRTLQNLLTEIIDEDQHNLIVEIISDVQKANGFYLSDNDHEHLCIYISIALMRILENYGVCNSPEDASKIRNSPEFKIANQISTKLQTALDANITEDEVISIAQYLMQANLIDEHYLPPKAIDTITRKDIIKFINKTITNIEKQFSTDFSEDHELIRGLILNLSSLLSSRKHKIFAKTPSLEEIKAEYPNELEMAIAISKAIKKQYQIKLSENEIGNIALYFCAATERKKIGQKDIPLKAVIICSSGIAGSQLLAIKIQRYFPRLNINGVYPAHRLPEVREKQPDFIISTTPLEKEEFPVIQVSHLFNDDDFHNLQNFMSSLSHISDSQDKQAFVKLFNPELFISGIKLNQQDEVIKLLCSALIEQNYVNEKFTQSVLEREMMFSTAIGNLVAIPHALPGHSTGSHIAVGILKKPITWGKDKVQLVFLLNIQNSPEEDFINIIEHFYDIIDSHNLIKKIIKTNNFNQFIQLIG